ncbi:MFS transporter [Pseudomonas sp. MAFF 301449]|uniref:MFS transporter n=1 Tax=Pseudomonas cyclaminis TaxID=2781239 RepID=A0ABR9SXG0_9PSED|nr:MFS transporter [Pseudomonas cyclaminis]MBE8593151.1 MFS transporter [Pseudomonas cyclaminis]MBE8600366.1 MFS transporter [Pseudomonas cyclaminis]VVN70104.1 Tetracycline resistance protein, class C [Pseudomonas fluorescens]
MNVERQARLPQSLLLLLGSCLPVLGAVLLAPILPRMQEHFADTPGVAVLVPIALTLPALMIALLAPVAGIIADRLGRKPLLISAMVLYTVCGVLPLWLESLQIIVISRAGIGVAEAAIMTCCTTMMGDYYSGARRERMFALQMVATSLSAAIFIAVGGVLGEQGWRTPFALYGLGLVFLPLMAWLLWEPRGQVVTATTVNRAFPWRALAPLYALAFLAGLSLFIVPVQVGYLLNLLHVEGSQQIGMTMGASQLGVLVGALSFRLFSGVPAYRQMLLALVAAGIGGGLLAVADSHGLVVIAVLINGLGIGLMMPTLLTWIMSQVDFQQRGRAAGGFTSMFFAGEFASPVVVLAITGGAISALPAALGIVAGVQLLVAVACIRLRGSGSAFPTAVAADPEH